MRLLNLFEAQQYPIQMICGWCQESMGIKQVNKEDLDQSMWDSENNRWISHGLCQNCSEQVGQEANRSSEEGGNLVQKEFDIEVAERARRMDKTRWMVDAAKKMPDPD